MAGRRLPDWRILLQLEADGLCNAAIAATYGVSPALVTRRWLAPGAGRPPEHPIHEIIQTPVIEGKIDFPTAPPKSMGKFIKIVGEIESEEDLRVEVVLDALRPFMKVHFHGGNDFPHLPITAAGGVP